MNIRKSLLALAFGALSFAPSWASPRLGSQVSSVPRGPGFRGGVVAVSHPLGGRSGSKDAAQGGNAIDAAAAIQFALNVVEPEFSGIGGGGFMMVHLAGGTTAPSSSKAARKRRPPPTPASLPIPTAPTRGSRPLRPAARRSACRAP